MGLADCQICSGNIARKEQDLFCTNCGFIVNSPLIDKTDSSFELPADKIKKMVDTGRKFVFLDVRTDEERAFSRIDGSIHMPMEKLAKNWFALDNRDLIIVYDHQGNKSLLAAKFLQQKGYAARSLVGGIENWAKTIDKTIKRYNKIVQGGRIRISDA